MKKAFFTILSLIILITISACSGTETPPDNPQENLPDNLQKSEIIQPQPPTQNEPHDDNAMSDPFGHQGGGDGHANFVHWGNDKLMSMPASFFDRFREYLGERELISTWGWMDYEGSITPYITSIMDFQNMYSLAVINNIPIEILIAAIDESNELTITIAKRQAERRGESFDEDAARRSTGMYTEEDKAVLLTQDEEKILAHFASPYAIVIKDRVYTPAWLYIHTPEEWQRVGITPEMVEERLELFSEFYFTPEAARAFESKLSDFTGRDVVFNAVS